jgi:hypothetical protein
MAGLIDVGILKPELADYGRMEQQRNLLAQQKQQAEMSQMKLEQLKRDQAMLNDLQTKLRAGGHSDNPKEFFRSLIQTGNPDYVAKGYEGLQRYTELERANALLRKEAPELFGPAPDVAAPAAPSAAPAPSVMRMQPPAAVAAAPVNALGSGTFDPNAAPVNALAPAAAAPSAVPAAAPADRARELRNKVLLYSSSGDPRLKAMADVYKAELQELTKPQTLAPGQQLYAGGKVVYTAPEKDSEFEKLLTKSGLSDPEKTALRIARAKKEATHAPGTTVTVSTEKKYGEAFGGKLADVDIGKMTTAENAPRMAESANRIIDLVKQGNVFTGPIADVKLNVARALNVAGASNEEKIANTEMLIAGTGQSTLDAIKSAGLGTGQGFTDKDLKFLQGVAGGTIGLTQKTLMDLATLQHRVATSSAAAWNKRVGEIPKEVVQGTGLSVTPIKVPPLSSVMGGATRPAGVGANWTFESDAAGNKAWVSPDRKSFKEAQ